ncbi:hypothetical protein BAMA_16280 [Bacillus manliponensis]|uniref:Uncharacterized protein n=1 Tax=Bacillus manliponensis TaxID=574376 RepID=A0A073K4N3_9BACI|nr:hypothetical protein [Bacillus manliponensis]KEK17248.1 hypothetical protein BAMA_16280 [Bacillus manliponensis]
MIFLFRFDIKESGIDFVLNEKIAEDMTPYYDDLLRPLAISLARTLNFYRAFSTDPTILYCNILDDNQLEIMLSKGLGQYIDAYTKNQIIFDNGKLIAEILMEVMSQHTIK